MYKSGVETVVKKSKWLKLLKQTKWGILATAGVYTATSVYSVHVSEVNLARRQQLDEYHEPDSDIVAGLVPKTDQFGLTAAHWCCINDDVEGLKLLIKEQCPTKLGLGTITTTSIPKCLSKKRKSFASTWGMVVHHAFFGENKQNMGKLEHLTDINPVQCAAFYGSTKIVEYLTDQKMLDFEQLDGAGNSLLTYAVLNDQIKMASVLMKTGMFDIDQRNFNGSTPLQLCANQARLKSCTFLLKNGADIHAVGPDGSMGAIRLCEHQFDLFEVEIRRGNVTQNPYQQCLEYMEEFAEELELRKSKKTSE